MKWRDTLNCSFGEIDDDGRDIGHISVNKRYCYQYVLVFTQKLQLEKPCLMLKVVFIGVF